MMVGHQQPHFQSNSSSATVVHNIKLAAGPQSDTNSVQVLLSTSQCTAKTQLLQTLFHSVTGSIRHSIVRSFSSCVTNSVTWRMFGCSKLWMARCRPCPLRLCDWRWEGHLSASGRSSLGTSQVGCCCGQCFGAVVTVCALARLCARLQKH
jgi:hypothetical protein